MNTYEIYSFITNELMGHVQAADDVQATIEAADQYGGDPMDYEAVKIS